MFQFLLAEVYTIKKTLFIINIVNLKVAMNCAGQAIAAGRDIMGRYYLELFAFQRHLALSNF